MGIQTNMTILFLALSCLAALTQAQTICPKLTPSNYTCQIPISTNRSFVSENGTVFQTNNNTGYLVSCKGEGFLKGFDLKIPLTSDEWFITSWITSEKNYTAWGNAGVTVNALWRGDEYLLFLSYPRIVALWIKTPTGMLPRYDWSSTCTVESFNATENKAVPCQTTKHYLYMNGSCSGNLWDSGREFVNTYAIQFKNGKGPYNVTSFCDCYTETLKQDPNTQKYYYVDWRQVPLSFTDAKNRTVQAKPIEGYSLTIDFKKASTREVIPIETNRLCLNNSP